jgi:antibiotic biosynthesis monooxygenase (ABM) superfamily enzyme
LKIACLRRWIVEMTLIEKDVTVQATNGNSHSLERNGCPYFARGTWHPGLVLVVVVLVFIVVFVVIFVFVLSVFLVLVLIVVLVLISVFILGCEVLRGWEYVALCEE